MESWLKSSTNNNQKYFDILKVRKLGQINDERTSSAVDTGTLLL